MTHRIYLPIVRKGTQPPPTATVRIVSSRTYTSGNTRYVIGEVINETGSPVYFVKVTAQFYDAANNLVAVDDANTFLAATQPGQRNPFEIALPNAPANITRYILSLSWDTSNALDYRPATIVSQQTRDNAGVEVFGELRNDQTRQLRGIEVAVTFYDAAGNVVQVELGSPGVTVLAPGATTPIGPARSPISATQTTASRHRAT